MTKREWQKADYETEQVNTMTLSPQLENAWSRAGILFGLLNAKIKSGYLVMVKDTEAVEFNWRVKVGRDWIAFNYLVSLDMLGQVGVSIGGLSATIVEHWNLRLTQAMERKPE